MALTFQEKKDLAIKLIERGVPQKEITKQSHLSFSSKAKIRKDIEGFTSEKNSKIKSTQAQAFMLFEKNKTPVHVAIKLDLAYEKVLRLHSNYLNLHYRHAVDSLLKENKENLGKFLKLLNILKEKKIKVNDFIQIVGLEIEIKNFNLEREQLELDIYNLKQTKIYHQMKIKGIKNKLIILEITKFLSSICLFYSICDP
jgi:hypothetical protein